ncbi:hypothetical protein HMPREF1554_01144 [Porphyromonas gingivalis F0569]|nr:hypothetical protein HMPREF1554_01144 [Porphyromonas gingivalis F0569]
MRRITSSIVIRYCKKILPEIYSLSAGETPFLEVFSPYFIGNS